GTDLRTLVVHGTADHPEGVAFRSTREISVTDELGRELMTETQVFTGGDYQRIGWTVFLHDAGGHVSDVFSSDGRHTETIWGCCSPESTTDADGIVRFMTYDALGRRTSQTRQGRDDSPDLTTACTLDASGALEPTSPDRITETDTQYETLNGDWFLTTTRRTYATDTDPTPTVTDISQERLTGLEMHR
ncbi:MAG: hypothetical protein V1793_05905, partial [Pseudomonadota bacterium]